MQAKYSVHGWRGATREDVLFLFLFLSCRLFRSLSRGKPVPADLPISGPSWLAAFAFALRKGTTRAETCARELRIAGKQGEM